jgi:hypothetical protein
MNKEAFIPILTSRGMKTASMRVDHVLISDYLGSLDYSISHKPRAFNAADAYIDES